MIEFLREFALCFVPMFVAVDPLGLLPVYLSITQTMGASQRRRLAQQAVPTALAIGVGFFLVGPPLLRSLGVALADLQIAGGVLLFSLAMLDLVLPGRPTVQESESLGIVPLATPLIAGPAVLTLGLVQVGQYGVLPALAAFAANLLILLALLIGIEGVVRYLPMNSMRAISKVIMLVLAAIGVSMVRTGVQAVIHGR